MLKQRVLIKGKNGHYRKIKRFSYGRFKCCSFGCNLKSKPTKCSKINNTCSWNRISKKTGKLVRIVRKNENSKVNHPHTTENQLVSRCCRMYVCDRKTKHCYKKGGVCHKLLPQTKHSIELKNAVKDSIKIAKEQLIKKHATKKKILI